jgi:hypothetical protein
MNIIKIILVVLALNFSSSVFAAITYTQFDNGDTYEGNWVNDVINGYGKYTWSSGDVYEGNLSNLSRDSLANVLELIHEI